MNLKDKIVLITGASRGIGRAVAEEFIDQGAHVIAVARTIGALEELDEYAKDRGSKITIVPLDITDFKKIEELGYHIFTKFGKLDIFIGNAGIIGDCLPLGHYNIKTWQKILDTNLTANWHFIRSFDALLKLSQAGRAIFVTSEMSRENTAYFGAYSASKSGLESMVKTYSNENQKTNLKINLVSPGAVRTQLRMQAFSNQSEKLKRPKEVVDLFVKLASEKCKTHGKIVSFKEEIICE